MDDQARRSAVMLSKDLHLHEEILLLALSDEEGTLLSGWTQPAIGGALLGELILSDCVAVRDDEKKTVVARRKPTAGDELLERAFAKVAAESEPQSASTWAARFAGPSDTIPKTAQGLIRRGILKLDEEKVLFLFKKKTYPEVDPRPEAALKERLRSAIFGDDKTVDPRTTVLIAVGHRTHLLAANFDPKALKAREKRIESIIEGDLAGDAVKQTADYTQAAFFVSMMVPIITS